MAIDWITETAFKDRENPTIADIGSGTGILTREFIGRGFRTYAVEPNPDMRGAAESSIESSLFVSIDGTAERTNLPSNSVDLITAAQAFHWFDREKAKREFKRILKPGGWIALLWNERRVDTPFLHDYEQFINDNSTDYQQVNHVTSAPDQIVIDFLGNGTQHKVFDVVQAFDFEGLFGRYASSSYAFKRETTEFEKAREELKPIFDRYQKNGRVQILYHNHVYLVQWN